MNAPANPSGEPEVGRLVSAEPDAFEGIPDLSNTMHGVADYLSLWCEMYGLREGDIVFGTPEWKTPDILGFTTRRRDRSAIHPRRWDPRLPKVPRVFHRRHFRIKRFVAACPAFRRLLLEVDRAVRVWLRFQKHYITAHPLKPSEVEVTNRWAPAGILIVKMIPKDGRPYGRRPYATHYRHDA